VDSVHDLRIYDSFENFKNAALSSEVDQVASFAAEQNHDAFQWETCFFQNDLISEAI